MNVHDFLKERGYTGPVKDSFNDTTYFHKKVPNTNHHQWVVREWRIQIPNGALYHRFNVEMSYETFDGTWVESKFYSLNGDDLIKKLPHLEDRIYAAVEAMGGDTYTYRGAKEEEGECEEPSYRDSYVSRKRRKKVVL